MHPEIPKKPGENLPPRSQKHQPVRENLQRRSVSLGKLLSDGDAACQEFQSLWERVASRPSGSLTFKLSVSEHPTKWHYHSQESTEEKRGPKTPREILDPNCPSVYQNKILLTNVHIQACISPAWSNELWREKWLNYHSPEKEALIVLGEYPLAPVDPAESSTRLTCAVYLGRYQYIEVIRYHHSLGQHRVVSQHEHPGDLVSFVVSKSKQRMHGPSSMLQIDEWAQALGVPPAPGNSIKIIPSA